MGQGQGRVPDRRPGRPLRRRRVLVGDARDNGSYLRTTWHLEGRVFVVSTWNDEVCTAAVRVPVEDVPELVSLLVDGLAEAAGAPPVDQPQASSTAGRGGSSDGGLLTLRRDVQAWLRHARARLGALISGEGGPRPERPPLTPPTGPPPTATPPDEIRWTA